MKKQFIKPPFLSTSFSESGEKAKERFANILSTNAKKLGAGLIALGAVTAFAAGALVACKSEEPPTSTHGQAAESENNIEPSEFDSLDKAISAAIISGSGSYADTEFWSSGQIILRDDVREHPTDGKKRHTVYAITSIGGYSFINGKFVKDSGSGAIPMKFEVTETPEGSFIMEGISTPEDGSYYLPSIKEMFPPNLWDEAIDSQDKYGELMEQEFSHARNYVESIGRDAEVCSYADLDTVLPDMSAEASNRLLEIKKDGEYWKYPDFIGTQEYLEDGGRFVYETSWDGNVTGGTLTCTKYDGDGALAEKHVFEIDGAEVFESRFEIYAHDGTVHSTVYDRSEAPKEPRKLK